MKKNTYYNEAMKSAYLFLLLSVVCSIKATEIEEERESSNSFLYISVQDALKRLKYSLKEQEIIRVFFEEQMKHTDYNTDFDHCKSSSCAELFDAGYKKSGIYKIYPKPAMKSKRMSVYCDMETDGGGWTVFQRRGDFEVNINFTRNWLNYSKGFGELDKEFWLGNENIHILSSQDEVVLRIDLEDFENNRRFAFYDEFHVESEDQLFKIKVDQYSGDADDSFGTTNGAIFATYDKNDENGCAKNYRGGWWYTIGCHTSNLNGRYLRGNHTTFADGVNWYHWRGFNYSLKWTEMKIRPKRFNQKNSSH